MRHTSNIEGRLKEAHDALQLAGDYIDALQKKGEKMATQYLSDSKLDELVKQLFPIAEDATPLVSKRNTERRELFHTALNADDLQNFKNTKWQFVNAAADLADHAQPIRMTATSRENRLKDIFNGHPLLDKAYELVLSA